MTLKEAYESDMPYRHITHRSWYERGNPAPMNVEMAIDSNWEINCDRNQTYVENRREVMALKEQIDMGLKRESELATKLGKLQYQFEKLQKESSHLSAYQCLHKEEIDVVEGEDAPFCTLKRNYNSLKKRYEALLKELPVTR